MRKNLLALGLAAILGSSTVSADTWGLIGAFNDWNDDVEMTETEDGVFSVTMESLTGEFKFRANGDWTLNYGADFSFDITGNASDIAMAQDGYNFSASSVLSDVTLTIDTNKRTLTISGLPTDMTVTAPEKAYLIGDPAGEWLPSVGYRMSSVGDRKFSWTGYLTVNQYFGFASELNYDDDWEVFNSHRYGPETDGTALSTTETNVVVYPKESSWVVPSTGIYTLTLDTENLTLTAEKEEIAAEDDTWGLVGAFSDWANDVQMTQSEMDSNVYSVTVENFSGEFKFRANNDWQYNFGAAGVSEITGNGEYGMTADGANFVLYDDVEKVTFTINVYTATLTVSDIAYSGVDTVAAADESAEYFNLQGVRMSKPEKGIYIRVVNGKSEKVVVK